MDTGKIGVAVVGLGNFGQVWAAAYAALPDVTHVGICEPNETLSFGGSICHDYRK